LIPASRCPPQQSYSPNPFCGFLANQHFDSDALWSARSLMRRGRQVGNGAQNDCGALADEPKPAELGNIPFAQRLTCTVVEACEVTGLGRTKLYELFGDGRVTTTTVGRRRPVLVQSLLALVGGNRSAVGGAEQLVEPEVPK
jgi:hypothetical protein